MVKKQKVIIFIIMCIFLFSIFKIGHTFASTETLSLTNVEIVNKSSTADVSGITYENTTITNNITFHKVGDTVTYRITVKNNGNENYIIKSINDDNTNEYITYEHDSYAGTKFNSNEEKTFDITVKYSTELTDMSKREQSFSVKFSFNFEDENGNNKTEEITIAPITNNGDNNNNKAISNQSDYTDTTIATSSIPKTGDNISFYIVLAIISFVMLIILLGKNYNKSSKSRKKLFSLFIAMAILLPTISKANSIILDISIQNSFKLYDKLIISREINGETIDETINYGDTLLEPEEPSKPGYIFKGWYLDDGTEYDFNTPITGDITINPQFEIITYDITYNLNGGNANNPTTYTVEDEIRLNNPNKIGYAFSGWTGTGLAEKTENVIIDKGSTDLRQYTANYVPIQYTISYELDGGIATNPNTYTIEDEITLNKPTREGYNFIGWTGTELTTNTENVTILEGSTENRTYRANWTPINYTITYEGLTNDEKIALNNPTAYNIETESITLNNPENRTDTDGDEVERFVGWKENQTVSTNITIPSGIGNKVYEAVWVEVDPNIYTVTYNLDGGTVENENRTSFKKTETFTLSNPTKRGYTFAGWTGSNGATPQTTVTVPVGTRENLNYTANWTEITYTITYNLNTGTVNPENPTTYTINSNNITLNNPIKTGYTFTGWTGTDLTEKTMEVVIPANSTENRNYTAIYEANTYTIIFDRNTGLGTMPNQELTYDEEENLNANVFTKTGYTFNGWNTKADGTGTAYTNNQEALNLLSENGATITIYAQWKANSYQVIYNKNGNDIIGTMDNQLFDYDEEKNLNTNTFSKEGYTFNGWNTKADGTGTSYSDGQNVKNLSITEDVTLYAQWRVNVYYIEFHANGGNGNQMERQTVLYNEETTLTQNQYTNTNSLFAGWNTNEDGSGTYYTDEQQILNMSNVDGDIINLYATWKEMKVGDYIDYHPESGNGVGLEYKSSSAPEGTTITGTFKSNDNMKWRILKISDEGITIVAERPTTEKVKLSGAYGYINGVKLLNGISDIYGHGIGAKGGRSINLDDIEPNFKFDKSTFTTGIRYGETRTYTSGKFIVDNNIVTASASSPQVLTQTVHWYNINSYAYPVAQNETKNKIYNMLCVDIPITNINGTNQKYSPYWLASKTQYLYSTTGASYGLHYIGDMHSIGTAEMGNRALFSTVETVYTAECSVLPIVELKQSIKYTYNKNTENWNIDYTPENYTVSFNSNGGTGVMSDEEFELGVEKGLTKNTFKKVGYLFDGWNTKVDGSGNSFEDEEVVNNLTTETNNSITLYAQWREINIGESVEYFTTLNDVTIDNWQVFYKDENYIYLITKDYIPNSAISDSLGLTKANTYSIYGENLQNIISTPSNWSSLLSGNLDGENIDYRTSSDSNVKAYGGPSIEIYTQSWNSKYPEDPLYISGNENGYYISKDEENLYTEMCLSEIITQGSNLQIISIKDATHGGVTYGYWLSSKSGKEGGQSLFSVGKHIIYTPTTVYNPEIESINPSGDGESSNIYQRLGLRPVVCMPLEAF